MSDHNDPHPTGTPETHPATGAALWEFLRQNARLVVVVTLFVLAVIVVIFIATSGGNPLYRLQKILGGRDYGTISFESATTNGYAAFDNGLAVGTASGLFTYNMEGRETELVQMPMSVPQLRTGGDLVLACDIGGSSICAIRADAGQVLKQQLDGTLLDSDVSADGAACYALSTAATKTLLTVLDQNQHEIYRWYSETAFFNQCAVSQNAEYLVGISLGQQSGSFDSQAVVFRTDSEEPVADLSLGNDYILDLDFTGSNSLCAVGESAIHCFTLRGDILGTYNYADTYLTHFDLAGDGFIALATNKNRAGGRFELTTLDTNGQILASLDIDAEILDISAAGNYLAVLTTEYLVIYNARLKVCASTDQVEGAEETVVRANGTALLISSGQATLFAG